jgi:hypothetical protein
VALVHGTIITSGDPAVRLRRLADEANAAARAADETFRQSVLHAVRCGEALVKAKALLRDAEGHGHWEQWLRTNFKHSVRTARLYMQLAELPEAKRQRVAEMPLRDVLRPAVDERHLLASVEYFTPARYVTAARAVLGGIDLDPASCAEANRVVQATTFYTREDDGLALPWRGKVWLNPPYCGQTAAFVGKLLAEYAAGNVRAAIAVVSAANTDATWFAPLLRDHFLCFVDHRIKFCGPNARDQPRNNSIFAYIGADPAAFIGGFSQFGYVLSRAAAPTNENPLGSPAGAA